MRQHILIIGIIICSILGGFIGASIFYFVQPGNMLEDFDTPAGKQQSMKDIESSISQIAQDISPSVVSIIIKKDMLIYRSDPWGFFHRPVGSVQREVGGGSGFFIRKDGIILTNKHVISDRDAEYSVVLSSGDEYNVEILGYVQNTDLALIRIQDSSRDFQALEVQSSTQDVQIGSFVIAIGNALAEFQNSVSFGIVSGKDRTIQAGGQELSGLLQTDAAINPGNSGGPLLDLDGQVIGVNTAIAAGADGVGFAIELNDEMIEGFLDKIK